MKVAAVMGLPFHRWVLEPTVAALRESGHEVVEVVHQPRGPHDWLAVQDDTAPAPLALRAARADFVLTCEYPYEQLRTWARARVVTVRHSLASRRNTWEREQGAADLLCRFGPWDVAELRRRGVAEQVQMVGGGCPWAEPVFSQPGGSTRAAPGTLLWAPTWNTDLGCHTMVLNGLEQLAADGWRIVVRPHGATRWRDPETMARMERVGSLDGAGAPWPALAAADVVVTDVSGFALLAALPGVNAALLQVTPSEGALNGHRQHDPWGPEWRFRQKLGLESRRGQGLADMARRLLEDDPCRASRAAVGRLVAGNIDGANARLVADMEAAWEQSG